MRKYHRIIFAAVIVCFLGCSVGAFPEPAWSFEPDTDPAEVTAGADADLGKGLNETAEPGADPNVSAAEPGTDSAPGSSFPEIDLSEAVSIRIENGEVITDLTNTGAWYNGETLELGEGAYILSGDMTGQVLVRAGKKKDTVLVLDGLSVINPGDAAIQCTKTASLTIVLQDGSDNLIQSGQEIPINEDCITLTQDASGGALYSKANTRITGEGTLQIRGYLNNGIHVTKSLYVDAGNLQITAVNHGMKSKNDMVINGGDIRILAGNDGIQAKTEAEDPQDAVIDEATGEILIEAVEGSEAAGTVTINGGDISIESYNDGIEALLDLTVNDGNVIIGAYGTYNTRGSYSKTHDTTFSAKGMKTDGTMTFYGGTVNIQSYNDALHSKGVMTIHDGNLSLYCGDDGIHSDVQIDINGGFIDIPNSYEGLEANQIYINGGTISLFAWDDGFNANGGRGFGSGRNRSDTPTETPNIFINDGDIYVNANGDGVDSNGNIQVNGGRLVVDGPTSNWNGPIDAGTENGGTITIYGGVVFAGGASGMAESFSSRSEQVSFLATTAGSYKEGALIRVLDPDGQELFRHTVASGGNSIVFSCPELMTDTTYTLEIDGTSYEVPLTGKAGRVNLKKSTND